MKACVLLTLLLSARVAAAAPSHRHHHAEAHWTCSSCDTNCTQSDIDRFKNRVSEEYTFVHNMKLSKKALAPWNYQSDADAERIPEEIRQAECSTHCRFDRARARPLPIQHRIHVYHVHRCPGAGQYRLARRALMVSLGCACVLLD